MQISSEFSMMSIFYYSRCGIINQPLPWVSVSYTVLISALALISFMVAKTILSLTIKCHYLVLTPQGSIIPIVFRGSSSIIAIANVISYLQKKGQRIILKCGSSSHKFITHSLDEKCVLWTLPKRGGADLL